LIGLILAEREAVDFGVEAISRLYDLGSIPSSLTYRLARTGLSAYNVS
jgi:hypothetical protein